MDGTGSKACSLSQRGTAKKGQHFSKSWAPLSPATPMFNGDQVWLEELIDPASNQSSPSQPSSPSDPSSSPGGSRSSSDGTDSLHSWNSGVTCILHKSIKKQSQEAFQTRLRGDREWEKLEAVPSSRPHGRGHPQAEQGGDSHSRNLHQGRGSVLSHTSSKSGKPQCVLKEKIEAKLKFSQFLDEVTSNVLDPNSLQAFGKPASPSGFINTNANQPQAEIHVVSPRLPCSMAQQQGPLAEQKTPEERTSPDLVEKKYLETDIDTVRKGDELHDLEIKADTPEQIDEKYVIPPPPEFSQGFKMKSHFPEFHYDFPRYPYRSISLPRGINMVSDESLPSL